MLADLKERRFFVQRNNTVFWHVWAFFFFLETSNLVLLRLIFFYFDLEARFRALRVTLGAEWSIIDLWSGVKWQSIQSRIYSAKSRHFARTNEKDTSHRLSDVFGFHMLTYIEENFFFQQIIFLFRDIALVRGLFTHWESKVSSWICSVVSKPRGSRISAFLVSDYFFWHFCCFWHEPKMRAFSLFTLYDLKYLKFARFWRYEYLYWTANSRRYGHQIFGSQNVLCSKKKAMEGKDVEVPCRGFTVLTFPVTCLI